MKMVFKFLTWTRERVGGGGKHFSPLNVSWQYRGYSPA